MEIDSGGSPEIAPIPRLHLIDSLTKREKLLTNFKELRNKECLLRLRESCKDMHDIGFNKKITRRWYRIN